MNIGKFVFKSTDQNLHQSLGPWSIMLVNDIVRITCWWCCSWLGHHISYLPCLVDFLCCIKMEALALQTSSCMKLRAQHLRHSSYGHRCTKSAAQHVSSLCFVIRLDNSFYYICRNSARGNMGMEPWMEHRLRVVAFGIWFWGDVWLMFTHHNHWQAK